MNNKAVGREEQQKILAGLSAEEKLDLLEKQSRNILELNPEYARRRLLYSFRRKRKEEKV